MGLFDWFKTKNETNNIEINSQNNQIEDSVAESSIIDKESNILNPIQETPKEEIFEFDDLKFEEGEKEEVAAVFAACLAGSQSNVKYKIKSITKVDPDLTACAVIAASCFAGARDDVKVRIKNIQRIK